MIFIILLFMQFIDCNPNCKEYLKFDHIGASDKHLPVINIYYMSDCEIKENCDIYSHNFGISQIKIDSIIKILEPDFISKIPRVEKNNNNNFGLFRVTYFNKSGDKIIGYLERYKMAKFLNSFYKILNTQTHTGDDKELILGLVDRII